jgi:hypothetical protein
MSTAGRSTDSRDLPAFERFLAAYTVDPDSKEGEPRLPMPGESIQGWREIMDVYSGCTFGNSIYRLHTQETGKWADEMLRRTVPRPSTCYCFGFDWLGRQFALHPRDRAGDEPGVALIDPVERRVLMTDRQYFLFHVEEVVDDPNSSFEFDDFEQWERANPESLPLKFNQIVGYKIPLSLGGEHEVENMMVVDIEVECSFMTQIDDQIADVPEGTQIRGVSLAGGNE